MAYSFDFFLHLKVEAGETAKPGILLTRVVDSVIDNQLVVGSHHDL